MCNGVSVEKTIVTEADLLLVNSSVNDAEISVGIEIKAFLTLDRDTTITNSRINVQRGEINIQTHSSQIIDSEITLGAESTVDLHILGSITGGRIHAVDGAKLIAPEALIVGVELIGINPVVPEFVVPNNFENQFAAPAPFQFDAGVHAQPALEDHAVPVVNADDASMLGSDSEGEF